MEELDLSDFFITKSQANDFSTRLSAVIEDIYQTDFNLEKVLTQQFGVTKADKFITFLRTNNIPKEGNELKTFLSKILEKVATLPILTITIAFEPSEKILQTIVQWCLLNIHKQVLFSITVDNKLIAGATIDFNGKHGDYSIKPKFNEILKTTVTAEISDTPKITPAVTTPTENQNTENFTLGR